MAISRQEKERRVALYKENISRSQGVIFTDYRGMAASEVNQLRAELKQVGGNFMVVKNTLLRIALGELGLPEPEELLKGPLALGLGYQDITQVAKKIVEYSEDSGLPVVKGGLMGKQLLSAEEIKALAELPPREVLLTQVASGIKAPLYGLVGVLSGVLRSFLYVLQARVQQLEAPQGA